VLSALCLVCLDLDCSSIQSLFIIVWYVVCSSLLPVTNRLYMQYQFGSCISTISIFGHQYPYMVIPQFGNVYHGTLYQPLVLHTTPNCEDTGSAHCNFSKIFNFVQLQAEPCTNLCNIVDIAKNPVCLQGCGGALSFFPKSFVSIFCHSIMPLCHSQIATKYRPRHM